MRRICERYKNAIAAVIVGDRSFILHELPTPAGFAPLPPWQPRPASIPQPRVFSATINPAQPPPPRFPPSLHGAAASAIEFQSPKLTNQPDELDSSLECTICMDAKKDCVFNCGHLACMSCAEMIYQCHLCKKRITERRKIFL